MLILSAIKKLMKLPIIFKHLYLLHSPINGNTVYVTTHVIIKHDTRHRSNNIINP